MKKLLLIAVMTGIVSVQAQDKSKVFSATEIVWFGLDFTKTKFVGQFDQGMGAMPATGQDMKNKWIYQWNSLIVSEQQNFDMRKALKKDNVYYDIANMNELNQKIDAGSCMVYNRGKIEKSTIDDMVKKYSSKDKKEGIGLAFVIENFDKGMQTATVYVTFFDIATKKVLLCEYMEGKAMGVGMRNYWAGTIKSILKQLGGGTFKSWQ